jgi:hypothetical protein
MLYYTSLKKNAMVITFIKAESVLRIDFWDSLSPSLAGRLLISGMRLSCINVCTSFASKCPPKGVTSTVQGQMCWVKHRGVVKALEPHRWNIGHPHFRGIRLLPCSALGAFQVHTLKLVEL